MTRKITSALVLIMLTAAGFTNAQLAGNYTIGGITPTYVTIGDAVNDLNLQGISAPVVFNIRDGVYAEKVVLTAVTGTSATNTITFQSENADSTLVTITSPASATATFNYTVSMTNADYVTFNQVTIERSGSNLDSRVIDLAGGCDFNMFTNCVIASGTTSGTSSFNAIIFSGTNTNDNNNVFMNNRIENGSFGFYIFGTSAAVVEDGNTIINNQIVNQTNYGIQSGYQSNFIIESNFITTTNTSYGTAAYALSCSGNCRVMSNKIELPNGGTGISLQQSNGGVGSEIQIANNFVSVGNTVAGSQAYGIRINSCSNTGIYFNTVNNTANVNNNRCFDATAAAAVTNTRVINNLFASNFAYLIGTATGAVNQINNNDLYTTGGNYCINNTTVYNSLLTWQAGTNFDSASVDISPQFMSATDLHIQTFSLNALAVPIVGITTDIDGDMRNVATPDIGADETTPPLIEAGVTKLIKPMNGSCGSGHTVVAALVKNFASVTQNNITAVAEITGTQTLTLSGTLTVALGVGQSDTIFFTPTLNTSNGDSLNIKVYTNLLNDENNDNDTLYLDSIYINSIPAAPTVPASVITCLNDSVSINATFPANQQVYWYATPSGGLQLHSGNPLTVSPSDTTVYYAEVRDTASSINVIDSLATMNTGGNGSSANFFDVTNTSTAPVTVHYLSTLIAGSQTATVYYLPGGLTSCTANPVIANFTMIGSVPVTGLGGAGSAYTFIPLDLNITIPAGQTYAFCISSPSITYTNGTATGTCPVFASDAIISIHEGFGGTIAAPIANRRLNGRVSYSTGSGCPSDRVPVEVDVIIPTVNLGNDTTIATPNSVTLDAGTGFVTYLWSNGFTTQTITVSTAGAYTVTVTTANGCVGNDVIIVNVINGIYEFGINSQIMISPIPAKDYLEISFKNMIGGDYAISLLNNLGERITSKIASIRSENTSTVFNLSTIAKGVYFVEVKNDKGIYRQRVLLQ